MMARWVAFTVWAAVAASAVFWGLKFFVHPAPPPAHAMVASPTSALRGDLTRLLGAEPPPAPAVAAPVQAESSRFQLLGVVATRGTHSVGQGVALIAVDGKPARAYKVGAIVDGTQVLQAVQPRGVSIGPRDGVAAFSLDLPALPPPSTGSLPPAQSATPVSAVPRPVVGFPVLRPQPVAPRFPGMMPVPQNNAQGGAANADNPQNDGTATR